MRINLIIVGRKRDNRANAKGSQSKDIDQFINPHIAFGFGYLASHYGMGLLTEDKVSEIMEYLEEHQFELQKVIETRIRKKDV